MVHSQIFGNSHSNKRYLTFYINTDCVS